MGFFSGNKSLGKLESWVSKRISDPSAASDFFTAQILMSLQLLKAHVSDVRRSLVERWHSCQLLLSGSSLEKLMSTRGRRGDSGCVFFAVVCACVHISVVTVTPSLWWCQHFMFVCEIETQWHAKGGVMRFPKVCDRSVFVGSVGPGFAFCRLNVLTMMWKVIIHYGTLPTVPMETT